MRYSEHLVPSSVEFLFRKKPSYCGQNPFRTQESMVATTGITGESSHSRAS